MMKIVKKKQGFTLIELLIVLFIIAILSTLAINGYTQYRRSTLLDFSVDSFISKFYELRDKGGVLGKINVRVYFAIIGDKKIILTLSAYKKEDEGKTPKHVIVRARNRLKITIKS